MAAVDYFLRIDGIEGESADAKHKGEIDVLSWSWGASNTGSGAGAGGGVGRASVQDRTSRPA
jgi:type VI secretion system secreted protein Hcp